MLALAAQVLNLHGRVTKSAEISEVTLYFEVIIDSFILHDRVRVHSFLDEVVVVVLHKGCVHSETTDQLVLERTLVHETEVNVPTEERVLVYLYRNFLFSKILTRLFLRLSLH